MRLRDLAANRVRYGYRRLHVLLRREGWKINPKRICLLYKEEGLKGSDEEAAEAGGPCHRGGGLDPREK